MSKWRKALKNNRKFDARYFLNERVENQEVVENSVQQEEVKRNFNDFSFDSWLTEDQDLEEAHCTSKRDDEELEEMHCGSSKRDDEDLEENMGDMYDPRKGYSPEDDIADRRKSQRKKDKKGDLEEAAKPDFLDLDKDGDKKEPMKKAAKEAEEDKEELEELQLGGEPKMTGDTKGMTPEEIKLAKAKEKMDLLRKASRGKPPVRKDVKRGLEEAEIEEG